MKAHMKKRKETKEEFLNLWDEEKKKIEQISKQFPNQLLLKVKEYEEQLTDELKEELFDLLWNMRLKEYLLKRVKEEIFKAAKNKAEYADWREKLLKKAQYSSEHVGFDRMGHLPKLSSAVKYNRWFDVLTKAIESKPESYISDILKAYSNVIQMKRLSLTIGSVVHKFKGSVNKKRDSVSRSRLSSRDSVSVDHLKVMDNMKAFFKKRTTIFNSQITSKLMQNLILAVMEHFLNRDGRSF